MAEPRTSPRVGKGEGLQVRARVIVVVMAGLLGLVMAVSFGFLLLFPNRIGVRFVPRSAFPAPAVVPDEKARRLALEAGQRRALAGAGGRMPITRAMAVIAARGSFDPVQP